MTDKELPEVSDYTEAQESIPVSLLSIYKELSEDKQKLFISHLDNLKSESKNYRDINGNEQDKMASVKGIANVAKSLVSDFPQISYEDILQYSYSFITRIQKNEFLELVLKEWLQLYIDDTAAKKNEEGFVEGISKVVARGIQGIKSPSNFIKGNS